MKTTKQTNPDVLTTIMSKLEKMGYNRGDEIPYYDFMETCDELNIDSQDINLDEMESRYDVAIG